MRLGRSLRALRIRRGLRQADLAGRVGRSHGTISNLERGRLAGVSLGTLGRVASELGADLDVRLRWRGEQLDRLLDEGHARLVEAVVRMLRRLGWETAVEVTFSINGERGSIDILAFHRRTAILLVIEIKSVMPDAQAMLAALDRKNRLAARIARERGWLPVSVSRLLIIEEGSTARGRVARLGAMLDAAYPDRGARVRQWLRAPAGTISGILFFRSASRDSTPAVPAGRQRVRTRHTLRTATRTGIPRTPSAPTPTTRA
jgi:transcriptional regulator with XRE-family HTH domain